MPRADNNELVEKARSLAHILGGDTSLISGGGVSFAYYVAFKNSAISVHRQYQKLVSETSRQRHLTHEIESIFDNFFVVETAIFEVRNNLKKRDIRKLPLIKTSKSGSLPRLYYILSKLAEETNGVLDKEIIEQFLFVYQGYSPLSIRELYAIPSILQVVFVEHFGKLIEKAIDSLKEYEEVGKITKRIKKEIRKKGPHNFSTIISELASKYSIVPLSLGFYLVQRLSPEAARLRPVLKWLKLNFEKQGIDMRHLADLENKERGKNSLTASNIIESLHWLTQVRWENVVEEINVVDGILSKDPAGAYSLMDMESKNYYRQIIVRIAEVSSIHEAEVARTATRLALQPSTSVAQKHVGYYLIDNGRELLEHKIGYKSTLKDRLYRYTIKNALMIYFGGAIVLDIFFTAILGAFLLQSGVGVWGVSAISFVALFLNFEISLSFLNIFFMRFLPVRRLPSLDLTNRISEKQSTFVVIPTIFRSIESVKETIRKIEVRYLGNKEDNVFYALLFGFKDALQENLPEDKALVETAIREVEALNLRYALSSKKFYMLYRKRVWNGSEGKFMEWERKRGKLREFNALLRGAKGTSYVNEDEIASVPHIKYVITLDEDTELPRDSASKLIGYIAHPLNAPVYSKEKNMVERGYGIMQPRTGVRLATAAKSFYSRLYSFSSGIDSYSNVASDIYQDLFGSVLFFGKGIYDIDTVEATMAGQIPDNLVLSHDLLEGIYARTGYASAVVLFDGFPNYYHEFSVRLHRWIRGDWQIMSWLRKVRQVSAPTLAREFSLIDRFKIFDNLRRSLVPVVALLVFIFAFINPQLVFIGSAYVCIMLAAPSLFTFLNDLFSIKLIPLRIRIADTFREFFSAIAHSVLRILLLPHHAFISISAISITLVRIFITKKKLLEWKISTDVGKKFRGRLHEFYATMYWTQVVPIVYFLYAILFDEYNVILSGFSIVWILSPVIAYLISRPLLTEISLAKKDEMMLRSVAYRTSRYFLGLSRSENNWLIQDHFQEYPKPLDTDRLTTSPTNIGMLFASLFSSYELGYVSLDQFIDRTRKAFTSLSKLDRHKGHLYNWYDIEKLEPLLPTYLSSVDSANFIVALIAFRQGIKSVSGRKIVGPHSLRGIKDALYTILEESNILYKNVDGGNEKVITRGLRNLVAKAYEKVVMHEKPVTFPEYYKLFTEIHSLVVDIEKTVANLRAEQEVKDADQLFFFVEHLAKLIEEELGFERYLLPHLHSRDHSIDTHVFRDHKLSLVYTKLISLIEQVPSLYDIADGLYDTVKEFDFKTITAESSLLPQTKEYVIAWYDDLMRDMSLSEKRAREFLADIGSVEKDCGRFIDEPDFGFLYNKERGLFHIGYNVTYEKLDSACYNFLASESNVVSFIAILKNQVPKKQWFYLGRKLVRSGGKIGLVSWGGSLFEYLTSLIYLKTHAGSLLGKTARSAISIHRDRGLKTRTPWGMGESAHYLFDVGKHYQYQVFGSSALGLKRGLADYLVVAPYVSALSLSFVPNAAIKNLRRIARLGGVGSFGFYDALDYTDENRKRLSRPLATKIYYAHHQGFTMLGIHNILDKDRLRNLFHSDLSVASLEILLEEKMPRTPSATTLLLPTRLPFTATHGISDDGTEIKQYVPTKTAYPHLALLGNGIYSTAISNAGAGCSKYKKILVTRFKDDPVLEESGSFIYIRNEKTKVMWSPTLRPCGGDTKKHKAIFYENKAEFHATNAGVVSKLEIAIDPKLPVEVRVLTLTNNSSTSEKLSVASYGEISLALENQDNHHPQFQKLLVRSAYVPDLGALVYSRPHPSDRTRKIHFAHILAKDGFAKEEISACADREYFIGRSRNLRDPAYFDRHRDEAVKEYTLDPIYSLSKSIELKPNESTRMVFVNVVSENYDNFLETVKKFRKGSVGAAVISRALKESSETTLELGVTGGMATLFQELASKALGGKQFGLNELPVSPLPYIHSLWKLGISGDYPLVVIKIKDIEDIQTIKHALLCHAYWKYKGIEIDVVILNQEPAGDIKVLDDEIEFLLRQSKGVKGGMAGSSMYHIKSDLTEDVDKKVLDHLARVILDSKEGTFKQQVGVSSRFEKVSKYSNKFVPKVRATSSVSKQVSVVGENLEFRNGWGGFDAKASEYVISVSSHNLPLSPWSNIITSPEFGTIVTESGVMFSWSKDSYDNRITSWNNDLLIFKSSEIIYLRDEETGELWNPTPMPIRTKTPFTVRHGKGYSIFEHVRGTLAYSLEIVASLTHPAKMMTLKIKNNGLKKRTISETIYLEPVMNVFRDHSRDLIVFERNEATGALFFKHSFRNQFPNRTAFADLSGGDFTVTTDKVEFLGRLGSFESPAALKRTGLSNKLTLNIENCAVLQAIVSLEPGEERDIKFFLGEASDRLEAENIVSSLRETNTVSEAKKDVLAHWQNITSAVVIETPDKALDALFNHQLLYQSLSARFWAKTGLYQPSGAFGFRDQLQDISAFVWTRPEDVKAFILKAARHQFKEGDALNWWHDYNDFGARSVLSDHQLWLVYVVLEYISVTGDDSILDIEAPFLDGPVLNFAYQREWAGTAKVSTESATIYEHCIRALAKSSILGEHGLPLIGQSDWNDGLSRAGILGRGESVWVGWFLGSLMERFTSLARSRNDQEKADYYREYSSNITKALEKYAWDGRWYRRVFLDSGAVLGTRKLTEFKIDSIAQSWAVISGLASKERAGKALDSMLSELYDGANIKLLTPALRDSLFDPGYIKDYPPGVRENGSQYNHAALWAAQALFEFGDSDNGKKILDLVNPFLRTDSPEKASVYRVEPYVVASDIYTKPSYEGRGGWTWYTGSAGVMYKTILKSLLGFNIKDGALSFSPSLPSAWRGCSITYKRGETTYKIKFEKPEGVFGEVEEVFEDGNLVPDKKIRLDSSKPVSEIRVVLRGKRK